MAALRPAMRPAPPWRRRYRPRVRRLSRQVQARDRPVLTVAAGARGRPTPARSLSWRPCARPDFRSEADRPIPPFGIASEPGRRRGPLRLLWHRTARRRDALHHLRHSRRLRTASAPRRCSRSSRLLRRSRRRGWHDPPACGRGRQAVAPGAPVRRLRHDSNAFKVIMVAAIVVVVAALLAVVAVPRLFPGVDPQKFVGTWSYAGKSTDKMGSRARRAPS